jgi:endogenous inhibitor of DNA gyrase (YacG/DUF329 family)
MIHYTYDPKTVDGWKSYPVRVRGLKPSQCHNKTTLLVQSMEHGFVTANCSQCGKKSFLSSEDFEDLHLWVSCPKCGKRMRLDIQDDNYSYACDNCRLYIWLAQLLPRWEDLGLE